MSRNGNAACTPSIGPGYLPVDPTYTRCTPLKPDPA